MRSSHRQETAQDSAGLQKRSREAQKSLTGTSLNQRIMQISRIFFSQHSRWRPIVDGASANETHPLWDKLMPAPKPQLVVPDGLVGDSM